VGRAYAGILGPLAFLAVLARGWKNHGGVETTLLSAWQALLAFAALGLLLGWLAGWIVDDSVRSRVAAELAASETAQPAPQGTKES
jgi:hypothetical protein